MASFCAVCADCPTDYHEDRSVSLTNPKHVLSRSPQRKKSMSSAATPSAAAATQPPPTSQVALLEDQVRRMQSQLNALSDRDRRTSTVPSPSPQQPHPAQRTTTVAAPQAGNGTFLSVAPAKQNAQDHAFVAALRRGYEPMQSDPTAQSCSRRPSHPPRPLSPFSRHGGSQSGSYHSSASEPRPFTTHLLDMSASQRVSQAAVPPEKRSSPAHDRSPPRRSRKEQSACCACENDIRLLASYVEMLRTGFFDLCEAVQSDLNTLRREQEAKTQDLQSTVAYQVNTAVRKEHLYHSLLEERVASSSQQQGRLSTTTAGIRQSATTAAEGKEKYVTMEEHNEVLLELRRMQVVVSELQKNQLELQREIWTQSSTTRTPPTTTTTTTATSEYLQSSVAQQVLSLTEPRLDALVRQQVAPLAEHVRALTSTHQHLIQTVVDERCKNWEDQLRVHSGRVEVQVAELRSRLASQSAEWRTAIQSVCAQLQVAVPPL